MIERSEDAADEVGVAAKRTNFLAELRRRNVIRVAGLYVVSAWLIVQVAATVLPAFAIPDWVMRATIILLAIGFVPTLVFSWVFELTPDGLRREGEITAAEDKTVHTGRKLDAAVIVLLLGIGGLTLWRPDLRPNDDTEVTPVARMPEGVPDPASKTTDATASEAGPSIAVLPFLNMSPHADNA